MTDDNVRPLRVAHPDDVPPTEPERQRADFAVDRALELGLLGFVGDGTDVVRLTWAGWHVAAALASVVDGTADQLVADGPPVARAALLGLHTTPERAMAVLQLLAQADRQYDSWARQVLARGEDPEDNP